MQLQVPAPFRYEDMVAVRDGERGTSRLQGRPRGELACRLSHYVPQAAITLGSAVHGFGAHTQTRPPTKLPIDHGGRSSSMSQSSNSSFEIVKARHCSEICRG